jgi:hypothetical protein
MAGWRWLLLEALPSVIGGVAMPLYLTDKISAAKWLSAEEKSLETGLAKESGHIEVHSASGAFTNRRVWVLCLCYSGIVMGLYGISFWLPTLVKASGVSDAFNAGLLAMIPYGATAIAMVLLGRSSDRSKERRWHVALPAVIGAVGLVACTQVPHSVALAVVSLTFATIGIANTLSRTPELCGDTWIMGPQSDYGKGEREGSMESPAVFSVNRLVGSECRSSISRRLPCSPDHRCRRNSSSITILEDASSSGRDRVFNDGILGRR